MAMKKTWLMMITVTVAMGASAARERPGSTTDECAVWQREADFARTVDTHYMAAFASFIDPSAVFNAGSTAPIRGRKAILEHWAGIVSGAPVKLLWRPHTVTIPVGGNVAFSTGPYTMINTKADATNRYLVGEFTTIWVRKDRNAQWLVSFDSGTDPRSVASEEEALGHLDEAPKTCSR